MHGRTVFAAIDLLAGKHLVAQCLHTTLQRQLEQQGLRDAVDQVFRQIGKNIRRILAKGVKPRRVSSKRLTQVKLFAGCIKMRL